MVRPICLERGADLHTAQQMPLPLTVSCFTKIHIGFSFLVSAHPGSPGQRAVKRVCVCVCVCVCVLSRTTRASRYQNGKTNLDFTEACDSEWQWHQLGRIMSQARKTLYGSLSLKSFVSNIFIGGSRDFGNRPTCKTQQYCETEKQREVSHGVFFCKMLRQSKLAAIIVVQIYTSCR